MVRTEFATLRGQWSTIKTTYPVLVLSFHNATNTQGNGIVSFLKQMNRRVKE